MVPFFSFEASVELLSAWLDADSEEAEPRTELDPVGGAGTHGPLAETADAAVSPAAAPNAAAADGYQGAGRGHPAGPFSILSLS